MVTDGAAGEGTHAAFAVKVEDLRRVLAVSDLPEDLRRTIALIPTLPRPDVVSVLVQVCAHLDLPDTCGWIRCKRKPSGEEELLNPFFVLKEIGTADRLILEKGTLKAAGNRFHWPEYLEIRMKAKEGADDTGSQDASEDEGGVEAGVFAVLLATALWRSEHRLIINRCAGD